VDAELDVKFANDQFAKVRPANMALVFRDKGTSGTQIEVLSNDLCIAHIGKEVMSVVAGHDVRWRWNFVVTIGPPGFQPHGHAETFEAHRPASN
jgi:hypothetical protein